MLVCEPIAISLDDVSVSLPEDEASEWTSGAVYALGDRVVQAHRVFQSMIDGNTAIDPETVDQTLVSAQWLEVEYTNAYRAFDGVLNNPMTASENVLIDLTVTSSFDVLFLFGVRGTSVNLRLFDTVDQLIGEREVQLGGHFVSGLWDWFTTLPAPRRDKAVFDLIPVAVRRVEIEISGGNLSLGEVFLGRSFYVGEMQPKSAGRAITSSGYEVNDFGRTSWVKRATRREMTYEVAADNTAFESIEPRMGELAGTLVATLGAIDIPSTIHFGILGTIEWAEDSPDDYLFSFKIKGIS